MFPDVAGMDSVRESGILLAGYVQQFLWESIFGPDAETHATLSPHLGMSVSTALVLYIPLNAEPENTVHNRGKTENLHQHEVKLNAAE